MQFLLKVAILNAKNTSQRKEGLTEELLGNLINLQVHEASDVDNILKIKIDRRSTEDALDFKR